MNNISKVSDITYKDLMDYLRLSDIESNDKNTLNNLINISKAYIMGYTGLDNEKLDEYQDFVIVVLILCQDMWDNRTLYIDNTNVNNVVQSILELHRNNLL